MTVLQTNGTTVVEPLGPTDTSRLLVPYFICLFIAQSTISIIITISFTTYG